MKIYNTLTKQKEEFIPIQKGKVKMYQCGPTFYSTQHIGNLRAAVLGDFIVRSLTALNYKVTFIRNYTDVGHLTSDNDQGEDKLEKASKKENLSPLEIAQKYIDIYEKDSQLLNILTPDYSPRATNHITEIISMTQTLLN